MTSTTGVVEPTTAETRKVPRTHKRVVAGAALSEIGFGITLTGLVFFTPAVLAEYPSWSSSAFLVYYTIYGLASALAMPLAGALINKLKAQGLMILGGIVATAGLVLFGAASSLWAFYLAGLVMGIGVGMSVQFVPIVVINRWFVEKRGSMMGLVLAGSGFGGVILGLIVPPLIVGIGWRSTIFILAILMAVSTILPSLFLIRNAPEDHGMEAFGAGQADATEKTESSRLDPGMRRDVAVVNLWFYVLMASLFILGILHAMNLHAVNYLAGEPWGIKFSPQLASVIVVLATVLLIPYKPLVGWLVDKLGLNAAMIITLGLFAVGAVIWAFAKTPSLFVIAILMIALGNAAGSVAPPLVVERAFGQREYAQIWAILGMAYPVGLSAGAPVWGLVPDLTGGYFWGFLSVPVITALILTGLLLSVHKIRDIWAPDAARMAAPAADVAPRNT
ncbi:nitrate/nitrite transporter [Corynebacterium sp. Marseille-P4321]|uniref:MFS transporter n=1 Tax=Corynebacterium sp. Marseille-P4321 TaxID=2736603 RepID=UPI00158E6393|nr:MFS transporter [Corynebacterium sp. Marseille-P4321]